MAKSADRDIIALMDIAAEVLRAAQELRDEVAPLRFLGPVTHVYNPLAYAFAPYAAYVRRFGATAKKVVFLGMNPGPYGMVQTGVPFGEVAAVAGWLKISAPVGKPVPEHPRRRVDGFSCRRSEVSGRRLWGAIAERFGSPENFFARYFVANYCPLAFLEASGRNRTPDKLPADERDPLFAACDRHLRRLVVALQAERVIGVGAFAAARAASALSGTAARTGRVLHPSPASPKANRDWAAAAAAELRAIGLCS